MRRYPIVAIAAALLLAGQQAAAQNTAEPAKAQPGKVERAANDVKQGAQQAGRKVGDAASEAGREVKQGAQQAGRKVGDAASEAGREVKQGAKETAAGAKRGWHEFKHSASESWRGVKGFFSRLFSG